MLVFEFKDKVTWLYLHDIRPDIGNVSEFNAGATAWTGGTAVKLPSGEILVIDAPPKKFMEIVKAAHEEPEAQHAHGDLKIIPLDISAMFWRHGHR